MKTKQAVRWHHRIDAPETVDSAGVFMGSFDPLHKGHEAVIRQLMKKFRVVVLLIPGIHFEKTVNFPFNARLEQRVEMIRNRYQVYRSRICIGIAEQVLFLEIHRYLKKMFSTAEIGFAMGNDTYRKFLDSRTYYLEAERRWGKDEERRLAELKDRILVFGRSRNQKGYLRVPENLQKISSTMIRRKIAELTYESRDLCAWQEKLKGLIDPSVCTDIFYKGLYPGMDIKKGRTANSAVRPEMTKQNLF